MEGHGRYHAEEPNDPAGAHTWGVTTGFKVKSRTAVIISRNVGLADPRREYCTRETSTDSPIAYALLDGGVSLLAGPDYRDISFGLDSAQEPGAWGGILCDKTGRNDPTTTRTVRGEVNWGGEFTFNVSCHQDASSGGVTNVSSLDFSVTFTPCPGHGRRVKSC